MKKRRSQALLVLVLGLIASPSSAADVTINDNGSFSPPLISVNEGDTVNFIRASGSLDRTDAIAQIGNPAGFSVARVCGGQAGGPAIPVAAGAALYGPRRKGVSGIHALGPQGYGFIEAIVPGTADCDAFFNAANDPMVTWATVATETDVATGQRTLLCSKFTRATPASPFVPTSHGNQGRISQITDSIWNDPDIDGVVLRVRWKDFQYDDGVQVVTVWTDIDREVRKAVAKGKVVSINIHAGEDTPDFIFTDYDRDPLMPGLQQLAASNVEPIYLKDYGSDPEPPPGCGGELTLGSPGDPNYEAKIMQLYTDLGAHFAQDARVFQAIGYVKVSGLNLFTGEARLPKHCHRPDGAAPGEVCVCNAEVWARALNPYSPTSLFTFYNNVENAIFNAFFGQKSLHYMLIQDGFPRVGDTGDFYRDSDHPGDDGITGTMDDGSFGTNFPTGIQQTNQVLEFGRNGRFTVPGNPVGMGNNPISGKLFVSQHSGLQTLGLDVDPAFVCQQTASHALLTDPATLKAYFDIYTGVAIPPMGGVGCPNEWAVEEGYRGQLTGFQTQNSVEQPEQVDSSLWNMMSASNASYYEIYEDAAWRIAKRMGTGATAAVLDSIAGFYPKQGSAYRKNLSQWGWQLHARRDALATFLATPNTDDPFPAVFSHVFSQPLAVGQIATYRYVDPARCSKATANPPYGTIVVVGI